MQTHIYPTPKELNAALAQWIADLINDTLQTKQRFTFCLSGGSTPKALYEVLASEYSDKINWSKVHFFWGDERYVPFDDKENNAGMAYKSLLTKLNVADEHIHVMRTDVAVVESIKQYEDILHQYFDGQQNSFDLVLLGMGEDGHTLSLFPDNEIASDESAWVQKANKEGSVRITLTPTIVNRAGSVVFLITGEGKAHTLKQVINRPYLPKKYPSQLIKPGNGNLHYFLDKAAAKEL